MKNFQKKKLISLAIILILIIHVIEPIVLAVELQDNEDIENLLGESNGDFEYTIENGTVTITKYIGNMENVVIPSQIEEFPVTKISSNTFNDFLNNMLELEILSVEIPETVSYIEWGTFSGINSLKSIIVDEDNESYSSEDGVFFDKNKTELITYPMGKEDHSYIIPNGVI